MDSASEPRPSWDRLYELAQSQSGLFTSSQARELGYSPQLLLHHQQAGRLLRVQRGIYRLVHFPASEHEHLVAAWLWSERAGVVSHVTALALHGLSDALPSHLHLTLPDAWRARRLRVPSGVRLHHADVPAGQRTWMGPLPVTTPARTLNDCARAGISPELLVAGTREALERGLVFRDELPHVQEALAGFGGLPS
jgi:predicted transcriptional regulator of viral defense system